MRRWKLSWSPFVLSALAAGCGGGTELAPAPTDGDPANDVVEPDGTLDDGLPDTAEPRDSGADTKDTTTPVDAADGSALDTSTIGDTGDAAPLDTSIIGDVSTDVPDVADTALEVAVDAPSDTCVPIANPCLAAGKVCGTAGDGCGGTVTCAGCSGTCIDGSCDITGAAVCSTAGWCFRHPTPQPFTINDAFLVAPNDVYAVAGNGTILHYDGTKWTGTTGLGTTPFYGVWASSSTDVWAVGGSEFGAPLVFRGDAASGFTSVAVPTTGNMMVGSIWGTSATDIGMIALEGSYTSSWRWNGTALARSSYITSTYRATGGAYESSPTSRWCTTSGALYGWGTTNYAIQDLAAYNSVWGTGTDVFAAGPTGRIKRRIGTTWTAMVTPSAAVTYHDISGSTSSNVYAVGANGTVGVVHRWDGTSWVDVSPPGATTLRAVVAASGLDVLALGDGGAIHKRLLGAWSKDSQTLLTTTITASSAYSADNVWFASKYTATAPTVGLIHWNGAAWDATAVGSVSTVWASGPASALYATEGTSAGIYSVTVGGSPILERSGTFNAIWGTSPADVWAVGQGLIVRRSSGTWSVVTHPLTGTTAQLRALWGSGPNDVWAGGDSGYLLHWDGTSWSLVTSGTTAPILSLSGTSSSDVWAVTASQVIRWNGTAWSVQDTSSTAGNNAISAGGSEVWVASLTTLRRREGTAFVAAPASVGAALRTIAVVPGGKKIWAAGNLGVVVQKSP
ncbi:MAG: hypothetical protein HYV09_38210 [Deltaproteobacteria bacterium]|nr:hypothetical protein [Deltaproteobacteria bacterium]